jgi:hypothetical protein
MSEDNVPETGPISVDDVLAAIQQQNVGRARAMFDDVMQQKVTDRLDAEKVKIAADVFNNAVETPEPGIVDMEAIAAAGEEAEEASSEQEDYVPDDDDDLESEIENAFETEVD